MALHTTGTIKHSQIMAEFEKTGKFALSADGAPLIEKPTNRIIKESDFYGADNTPPGVNGWPCQTEMIETCAAGFLANPKEYSNPCRYEWGRGATAHAKGSAHYDLKFAISPNTQYEIDYDFYMVRGGKSGSWWGHGLIHWITQTACTDKSYLPSGSYTLTKMWHYTEEVVHQFRDDAVRLSSYVTIDRTSRTPPEYQKELSGTYRCTTPNDTRIEGRNTQIRIASSNANGHQDTVGMTIISININNV